MTTGDTEFRVLQMRGDGARAQEEPVADLRVDQPRRRRDLVEVPAITPESAGTGQGREDFFARQHGRWRKQGGELVSVLGGWHRIMLPYSHTIARGLAYLARLFHGSGVGVQYRMFVMWRPAFTRLAEQPVGTERRRITSARVNYSQTAAT